MASAWIVHRKTRAGEDRWHVKWEGPPVERVDGSVRSRFHVGAFKTEEQALARKRWAEDEWAAGRVPDPKRIVTRADEGERLRVVADDWLASRLDLAPASRAQYKSRVARIQDDLGSLRTGQVDARDVREWVAKLDREFAPATIGVFLHVLRLILDHAEVEPNPARHRSVKLPKGRTTNQRVRLPTRDEISIIRRAVTPEVVRVLDLLEDAGLRIAEATSLDWSDVRDDAILVRGTKRHASTRIIRPDLHPIRLLDEERQARGPVFSIGGGGVRDAIGRACERHKPPLRRYSPHDWRHLHISRLVHGGAPPAEVAYRAGHASAATTLRIYSHVLPPD